MYLQSSLSGGQQSSADILTNALGGTGASNYTQFLFPSYTGQVGAPVSGATTGAVSGLEAGIPAASNAASMTPGTTSTGLGALSGVLSTQPQDLSSYFQSSLLAPAEQTLQQTTLPGIMSSAGGSVGGYQSTSESSSIADAIGSAYSGLASSLGSTAYDTAQTATSQQTQALSQLSTITGIPANTLSTILSAGTTTQGAQQTYLSKLYSDYQQGLTNTQTFVQNIVDYLNTQTMTAANQAVSSGGSSGLLGSLFSGLGNSTLGTSLGKYIAGSSGSSGSGGAVGGSYSLG